ncbi:tryptophan synthase subunit beta [Desulfofalx alkaliphila]|uniref:tryptophan synthase subunit beta n=1 Tax=Desulfofalx alkaliphila TaxID=105483 RepID=UPI0004E238E5|nr:tryptophan synthase subunit beta [Desulfofalx alkaliphila]
MTHQPGYFGHYGGQYVPDQLKPALQELEEAYLTIRQDPEFFRELRYYLKYYVGRPSPLYHARGLSSYLGGAQIYLKREDLNHTGAHKINNAIGQILLARKMGKKRIIAETGAGQHGVATATAAAMFNLPCTIFMGEEDIRRQELNVFRMRMLGAEIRSVARGSRTLAEAVDDALNYWVQNLEDTYYLIGSAVGPHPFPTMVRDFQAIIGHEARYQILEQAGRLPDYVIACVGGGSNAIGIFTSFLGDAAVQLIGAEAGGINLENGQHAATMTLGRPAILHGCRTYVLQDDQGGVMPVYSISAGLDYPGVGPELSYLKDGGRVKFVPIKDREALDAFQLICKTEGIIPALESSHALAEAMKLAPKLSSQHILLVSLSGRGDKDVHQVAEVLGKQIQQ